MKIYTKKGDEGETSLLGGKKVSKNDLRIEAYGTLDELNAHIGMLSTLNTLESWLPLMREVQSNLFSIGAILACDPEDQHFSLPTISEASVDPLERSIDELDEKLPPLKNFVLPGGHSHNAMLHIARCVCRRAERRVVALHQVSPLSPVILVYLNRLSDWLFVLSRMVSVLTGTEEVKWKAGA